MKQITILGAGLAGSLAALYLAKRGYAIDLYESRPDIRTSNQDSGRSINLAMSCRGLTALRKPGIGDEIDRLLVPMRARAIHEEGTILYQAFGRRPDEYINAVLRSDLNKLLLNTLHDHVTVNTHFNMKLLAFDVYKKLLYFEDSSGEKFTKPYHRLIAADGANSFIRESLEMSGLIQSKRTFLDHGYKELSIMNSSKQTLIREHLHLWPRDSFLLLGNPNKDHSLTGTLFLPHQGKNSFAELDNELSLDSFFKEAFPDAFSCMPNAISEFLYHPTGRMSSIDCSPWYYDDQCLLIGDAAHGVVPFFGQGMNSAFEDCRVLNELLNEYEDNWQKVMPIFSRIRKVNTDAVARMSLENYQEIQTNIRNPEFNFKKQLEQLLMSRYPDTYVSKHVLVMFTNTPYALAEACGHLQETLLNKISLKARSTDEIDWTMVDHFIREYDKKLAEISSIEKLE